MAGSGKIRKRGKGYQVDVTMHDGRRVRRTAPTHAEAMALLGALQRAKARGEGTHTLGDVLNRYIAHLRVHREPGTVSQALVHDGHLRAHFGETALVEQIGAPEVDGFIAARKAAGKSTSTINGSLRILRAAARHAGLKSPVKLLREVRRPARVIDEAEGLPALLRAAPEPYDLMILLAAKAGLRHREILHLQVRDVDLGEQVVRVTAKERRLDGLDWKPKDHEEREIPFGEALRDRLSRHLAGLAATHPRAWLFPGYEGQPRRSVAVQMREVWTDAGLYDRTQKPGLHQLRRTWATALLGAGVDIETVRQLGGWSDLETVQRYLTSTDERKRRAIAALG